jgi:hypothetical protein
MRAVTFAKPDRIPLPQQLKTAAIDKDRSGFERVAKEMVSRQAALPDATRRGLERFGYGCSTRRPSIGRSPYSKSM